MCARACRAAAISVGARCTAAIHDGAHCVAAIHRRVSDSGGINLVRLRPSKEAIMSGYISPETIKELRTTHALTQEQLAAQIGVTAKAVSK